MKGYDPYGGLGKIGYMKATKALSSPIPKSMGTPFAHRAMSTSGLAASSGTLSNSNSTVATNPAAARGVNLKL